MHILRICYAPRALTAMAKFDSYAPRVGAGGPWGGAGSRGRAVGGGLHGQLDLAVLLRQARYLHAQRVHIVLQHTATH